MPYDDPDPVDPMTLTGVVVPCSDPAATREMASCFAQEFLMMGTAPEAVLALFRDPFYRGPHQAWQALGEEAIRAIVEELRPLWRPLAVEDAPDAGGASAVPPDAFEV